MFQKKEIGDFTWILEIICHSTECDSMELQKYLFVNEWRSQ